MRALNVGSIRGWIVCLMDAVPAGVLWVNRGADANRLDDLLAFMSNAILTCSKDIFGMQKPSKFNLPRRNERAKELNAQYKQTNKQTI